MDPPSLPALCVLLLVYGGQAVALSWIDGREHRLPNRRVGMLTLSTVLALGLAALIDPALRPLLRVGLVLAVLCAVAGIALALVAPQLIGMGDAKTAPVVVLMTSALGPFSLLAGLLGVALVGGVAGGLVWAISRRADARFAYGPVLLSAPFLGLLASPLVAAALGAG
ncbi:hypothetical protein [Brachybacterium hainanense]|uniref:Prepilin type IV endopeptidase peptidase domain-containing protein n=1 Tax=Brachybacterium hainanense TaxID=1541174 RepID=A0ABV6RBA2_9MICO